MFERAVSAASCRVRITSHGQSPADVPGCAVAFDGDGAGGAAGRGDVRGRVGYLTTISNIQRAGAVVADAKFIGVGPVEPAPLTVTEALPKGVPPARAMLPLLLETLPPFLNGEIASSLSAEEEVARHIPI